MPPPAPPRRPAPPVQLVRLVGAKQPTLNKLDAPGEVVAPSEDVDYAEYRKLTNLREPYA